MITEHLKATRATFHLIVVLHDEKVLHQYYSTTSLSIARQRALSFLAHSPLITAEPASMMLFKCGGGGRLIDIIANGHTIRKEQKV